MTNRFAPVFAVAAWLALAAIIFVTVSPIGLRPHDVLPVNLDRALAFALVAVLFVMAYPRHWLWIAVALTIGAGAIELLQELSSTRHARFDDALVKAAGALGGVLVAHAINRYRATAVTSGA
jgi:VanZ family protein